MNPFLSRRNFLKSAGLGLGAFGLSGCSGIQEAPWGTDAPDPAAGAGRTTHPDAQWFPKAGFGFFLHWGIHSVEGLQPSWAMLKGCPFGGKTAFDSPEKYWGLASRFDPQKYDPDLWMAAAAKAGFTYAVLGAKHHDGYALWPTRHGDFGVRQFLGGRDLIRPYLEACRKHGLKAGLYFSPRDWRHPGFLLGPYEGFVYRPEPKAPIRAADSEEDRRKFEKFLDYTRGQLQELLTGYGKIDLLWFDGVCWFTRSDDELRREEVIAWVRRLQPGIVVNDRWSNFKDAGGDFQSSFEGHLPKKRPEGWWESCTSWNGHWGYNRGRACQPNSWVLKNLVQCRAWGGNFLLNCGPAPDGTMPPDFYERCGELAAWMAHSRESLIGADPSPGDDLGNVPLTRRGRTWYLHVLPDHRGEVELRAPSAPSSVRLMRTGGAVPARREGEVLKIALPPEARTGPDDVVAVAWQP